HWIFQAVRMIRPFFVMSDFDAKSTMRKRVGSVATHTDGDAVVVDVDEHRAGVRAIVGTYRMNRFHRFPFSSAAFFMAATRLSRRSYSFFSSRGLRLANAYAVSNGSATVLSR